MNAYHDIYEQFANDAAFFWLLRCVAVNQPNYFTADIRELDQRIDAQLEGLLTATEDSWAICRAAMDTQQKGEAFVAAVLAFHSEDMAKIQYAVEHAMTCEETIAGLASALAWLPGRLCHSWVKKFFTSKDLAHKYLAVTVCSLRREDPLEYLTHIFQREDCIAHDALYARSLRLVGELKRRDLSPVLSIALQSDKPEVLFWASWSTLMLGDRSAVKLLQPFVLTTSPRQLKAIELVFRALPVTEARDWIGLLASDPEQIRMVIKATAVLGDPHAVNWLIAQMRVPALARLAGEAFSTITGIVLEDKLLTIDPAVDGELANIGTGPNDDPADGNVSMDEDERLPFPDADKIAVLWQECQQRFSAGQRCLLGQPIDVDYLSRIYNSVNQRQRRAIALELALLQSDYFLQNYATKGATE